MIHKFDRRSFVGLGAMAAAGAMVFGRSSAAKAAFPITRTADQWHRMLSPERYHILREAGTERPFSSPLLDEHRRGDFVCAGCSLPLFSSATKFESGTGWPSFWKPLPNAVVTRSDHSAFMDRTEVLCRRCGSHLGHVFDDGPKPTGLRYCMNGLALGFHVA